MGASLYVGDLDPEVTQMELTEAFSVIGPIDSVRLCRDSLTGKSLRYAYVNFFSHSHASKARACLNHTNLRGKPMRIVWSQRDPFPTKTGIGNLFVRNLDHSINSYSLQCLFCEFGTIISCKVAEKNGKSKGFGFIQFESEDSATAARNALHNTMVEGKKLYAALFVKKSKGTKACEEPEFKMLCVKNMGEDVTEDLLQHKFSEFGKISNVAIVRDLEGKSRGSGFVCFESPEAAKNAVNALNGALFGLKKLIVERAQKKYENEELKSEYKGMLNGHVENLKPSNLYVKSGKLKGYADESDPITPAIPIFICDRKVHEIERSDDYDLLSFMYVLHSKWAKFTGKRPYYVNVYDPWPGYKLEFLYVVNQKIEVLNPYDHFGWFISNVNKIVAHCCDGTVPSGITGDN